MAQLAVVQSEPAQSPEQTLHRITVELREIGEKLAGVTRRRRDLALRIVQGDPAAAREAADLTSEEESLETRRALLEDALEPAQAAARVAQEARSLALRRKNAAEFARTQAEALEVAAEIDAAMSSLAALLDRRQVLALSLNKLGFPEGEVGRSMVGNPSALHRAADAAGLVRFMPSLGAAEGGASLAGLDAVSLDIPPSVRRLLAS